MVFDLYIPPAPRATWAKRPSAPPPSPATRRLWKCGIGAAIFILTIAIGNFFLPADHALHLNDFGLDFLPFYSAGQFVSTGHADRLYDLPAIFASEQTVARRYDLSLGGRAGGPFWYPPAYAWLFVPFAHLSFPAALLTWTILNLLALAVAIALLIKMLPGDTPLSQKLLVPLLVIVSVPFIMALGHGQNTFTSLLLLCATVTMWRQRRAVAAGIFCGLLFYKPQLAALVAIVLALDLGWRVIGAAGLAAMVWCIASIFALPEPHAASSAHLPAWLAHTALADYIARFPGILHQLQDEHLYAWERHPTLRSLARMAVQGTAIGPTHLLAAAIAAATGLLLVSGLAIAARRSRVVNEDDCWTGLTPTVRRDRLIAATIACAPLLAPFYFDYDLLILAIPAVLLASERISRSAIAPCGADHWATRGLCILSALLTINMAASHFLGVNLAALALLLTATPLIMRAARAVDPLVEPASFTASHLAAPPVRRAA